MTYTIAKEKFPKKPLDGNILEVCRKDFKNFKKDNENRVIEYLQLQIMDFAQLGSPNRVLVDQNENLKRVRNLIHEGREDVAFSIFFRTFPSCLPYRTRNP